jgi:GH25 family lysozyme M1 (1,4-beta-N-acetylmuramidase)
VQSPDLYEFNPEPRWLLLRLRTQRVILKASQGTGHVDSKFAARYKTARRLGLSVIAYHFCEPDNFTPKDEAEHFLSVIGNRKLYALALDCESRQGHDPVAALGPGQLAQWCRDFNQHVHAKRGVWPYFYANRDYIKRLALTKPIGGGLWLADYGTNDGRQHPVLAPQPWKRIRLHQFTSQGRILGMAAPGDVSAWLY